MTTGAATRLQYLLKGLAGYDVYVVEENETLVVCTRNTWEEERQDAILDYAMLNFKEDVPVFFRFITGREESFA